MYIIHARLLNVLNDEPLGSIDHHVATVMLEHISELADLSIGELADRCTVSKSTLSKFVRKRGFEDYIDFKLEAKRQREKEIYIHGQKTTNITDYLEQYGAGAYLKALADDARLLFDGTNASTIEELARDIHRHQKIAAFGEGYSETACLNLQIKMSYYQKFIYTTQNDITQTEYIEQADHDSLVLVISNSGRFIGSYAHREGEPEKSCFDRCRARVYLITSNPAMVHDRRVFRCIMLRYSHDVQNHPVLFQLLIEQIALCYQKLYGFPQEQA